MMADAPGAGPVTDLPGYGPVKERQLAGNLPADDGGRNFVYFWFFESRTDPANDPVVLWLNGGPGSSSLLGLFAECGPYRIADGPTLQDNPWAWNRRANLLVIDQPTGTGLSLALDPDGQPRTEEEASQQLVHALRGFLDQWPEYQGRDLYLFGESYAGVYVPLLATNLLDAERAGDGLPVRLAGIGVGDGWVDPTIQQATYRAYAYAHGLVGPREAHEVDGLYAACAQAIRDSGPVSSREADEVCNRIEQYITRVSGGANVYDVRRTGDYDFDSIGDYVDRPDVRRALHVDPRVPPWQETSKRVAWLLERGEQDSYAHLYPRLFESVRVLLYNGVYDMDCNFMGTDAWIAAQDWSYRDAFLGTPRAPWTVGSRVLGRMRATGNLTQVLVDGAGHLVPMDQPEAALALLEGFLHGDPPLVATPTPERPERKDPTTTGPAEAPGRRRTIA